MAYKNVTAKDARKREVVDALKRASGARSVTMLHEDTDLGLFAGHCFNKGRGGASHGWFAVDALGEFFGHYHSFEAFKLGLSVVGKDSPNYSQGCAGCEHLFR